MSFRSGPSPLLKIIAALALVLLAGPASAHLDESLTGGFLAGFHHPLSGPDHLLAMVAVGIWGAFLGRPLVVLLPVIFPTVMAFGGALGMAGVPMPPVEIGIALSVLLLGGAIAFAWRAPVWIAVTLVAIFAIFHGYAHGAELPSIADPIAFSLGFVLATGLLHVAGILLGLLNDRPGGEIATRVVGGLIAATGVYFLYRAIP
ncbi:HupE/UreJ family protein [Sphingomonas naphthae]|uniref:HupE/UreJ family protein n=1 Tax=Sphingomonas naphthae TaxID=1813468 RepID=A0ABY7TMI2_9SPHN|nr:HupE/UreJ family protein [Sphingomonas naphthae]WCT74447.1 HupE/UreJ family protein [Sphingomonas naphthae]